MIVPIVNVDEIENSKDHYLYEPNYLLPLEPKIASTPKLFEFFKLRQEMLNYNVRNDIPACTQRDRGLNLHHARSEA